MTYDVSGRFTSIAVNGTPFDSFTYDSNGNRLTQSSQVFGNISSTYNGDDELLTMGNYVYTYTPNGERASRLNTTTGAQTLYGYDVFGDLTSVTLPDGNVIGYQFDEQGRRVAKLVNGVFNEGYVYQDGLRIVARINSKGQLGDIYGYPNLSNIPEQVNHFTYNSEGEETSLSSLRVIADERGSPEALLYADGTVAEQISMDEFGNILQDTNPSLYLFRFAGCLYDQDTGLCHFGAREYDPATGRWLQRDPINFKGADSNLYGYVMNDPINNFDPLGLWSFSIGGYAGVGGGVTFGQNPGAGAGAGWFVTFNLGYGVGGGFSYNPSGTAPGYSQGSSCPFASSPMLGIGGFGEVNANAGPASIGIETNGGLDITPQGPTTPYFSFDPVWAEV